MASILVTGASKGIGLATALVLGRAGHTVYATMRDPIRSPDLAQTAETEHLPLTILPIENDSRTLRYPVGPDAEGYLQWRASMTDEEWIEWGASDDDAWYSNVERTFGMDARPRALREHPS